MNLNENRLIKVENLSKSFPGVRALHEINLDISSTKQAIDLGISCIYQELTIVPLLDVARNIFIGNLPMGKMGFYNEKSMYRKAQEILDILGVNISPKTLVKDLSIAQQQMTEICRALV